MFPLSLVDFSPSETALEILEFLKANPGASTPEAAEAVGVAYKTATYHLDRLSRAGYLSRFSFSGSHIHHYVPKTFHLKTHEQRALVLLQTPGSAELLDLVLAEPGLSKRDAARRLGTAPTTISWHARRLVEAGLLEIARTGRACTLRATAAALETLARARGALTKVVATPAVAGYGAPARAAPGAV